MGGYLIDSVMKFCLRHSRKNRSVLPYKLKTVNIFLVGKLRWHFHINKTKILYYDDLHMCQRALFAYSSPYVES